MRVTRRLATLEAAQRVSENVGFRAPGENGAMDPV